MLCNSFPPPVLPGPGDEASGVVIPRHVNGGLPEPRSYPRLPRNEASAPFITHSPRATPTALIELSVSPASVQDFSRRIASASSRAFPALREARISCSCSSSMAVASSDGARVQSPTFFQNSDQSAPPQRDCPDTVDHARLRSVPLLSDDRHECRRWIATPAYMLCRPPKASSLPSRGRQTQIGLNFQGSSSSSAPEPSAFDRDVCIACPPSRFTSRALDGLTTSGSWRRSLPRIRNA